MLHAEAAYHFSAATNDWGFTSFVTQQDAYSPKEGFLVNDALRFNVVVRIDRQEDYNYDSKKATGYVGLKNQGATCYMNSLLQTLYNINYFRQVHAYQHATAVVKDALYLVALYLVAAWLTTCTAVYAISLQWKPRQLQAAHAASSSLTCRSK